MSEITRFVGLDVHAATIAIGVAEEGRSAVEDRGTIPNEPHAVRRLVGRLREPWDSTGCRLRGRSHRIRALPTARQPGRRAHRYRPVFDPPDPRRPGQD